LYILHLSELDRSLISRNLSTPELEVRIVNGGKNMPAYGGILNKKELAEIIVFLTTKK
jgi:ubiquinol-cytochrome c reductase cytochrome b subunit